MRVDLHDLFPPDQVDYAAAVIATFLQELALQFESPTCAESAIIMPGSPAMSTLHSRGCLRLTMIRSGRLALIPVRVPSDPWRNTSRCFIRNSLGQSGGFIEGRNT